MFDDPANQRQTQKDLPDIPEVSSDGIQRFTADQFKNFVEGIVKKEYVRAKHGLEDWEIEALSTSAGKTERLPSSDLLQESNPVKLREILPEGTLIQSIFDDLIKLLPNPDSRTDWLAVADLMDGGIVTKSSKQSREQIKDAVYRINIKFKEHNIAPLFRWGRNEISRCR